MLGTHPKQEQTSNPKTPNTCLLGITQTLKLIDWWIVPLGISNSTAM